MNVIVVGAGIAGLLTALQVLKNGEADVIVFEKRREVGRKHCAGIVSTRVVELIDAYDFIEASYRTLCISIPLTKIRLKISCDRVFAHKIDRVEHERYLAQVVEELGGKIFLQSNVMKVEPHSKNGVAYVHKEGSVIKISGDFVVVAEGVERRIANSLGLRSVEHRRYGIQTVIETIRGLEEDRIDVVYDPINIEGFAWIASLSRRKALIGIVAQSNVLERLSMLLRCLDKYVGVSRVVERPFGGIVLRGYPIRIGLGKVVGVGDCVSMVKSVSGGGLYAISIASRMVAKLVSSNRIDALHELSNLCMELRRQYLLAKFVDTILKELSMFKTFSKWIEVEIAITELDWDKHVDLIKRLARFVKRISVVS